MKFEHRYILAAKEGRKRWEWGVANAQGGVSFWVRETERRNVVSPYRGRPEFYNGMLVFHYRRSPSEEYPANPQCWLLDGPCWHDGGMLIADELWIPRWFHNQTDHDLMFRCLEEEAERRFEEES